MEVLKVTWATGDFSGPHKLEQGFGLNYRIIIRGNPKGNYFGFYVTSRNLREAAWLLQSRQQLERFGIISSRALYIK